MKTIKVRFFIILCIGLLLFGCTQSTSTKEKLLGVITKGDLAQGTYGKWFTPNYNSYETDDAKLKAHKSDLEKFTIHIFMGTWCGDSKKEVPRFYKVLENIQFPSEKIKLVAVDNSSENYKKSPTGEEKGLNIVRVPTFIFYKDGTEVNRIIEHPITDFETDIVNIITTNTYIPNYYGIVIK